MSSRALVIIVVVVALLVAAAIYMHRPRGAASAQPAFHDTALGD
jgi:hypothetical protein